MIYYYMAAVSPNVGDEFVQVRHGCVPVDEPEDWAGAEELARLIEERDGAEVLSVKVGTLEELLDELFQVRGDGELPLARKLRAQLGERALLDRDRDEGEGPLGPIFMEDPTGYREDGYRNDLDLLQQCFERPEEED